MESLARIIEAEVALASGIVIERVSEEPPRPRRRRGRSLVLVAALVGIASGLAASRIPTAGPPGSRSEIVRPGVQVAKLRSDTAPCPRDPLEVLVCGVTPDGVGVEALHE